MRPSCRSWQILSYRHDTATEFGDFDGRTAQGGQSQAEGIRQAGRRLRQVRAKQLEQLGEQTSDFKEVASDTYERLTAKKPDPYELAIAAPRRLVIRPREDAEQVDIIRPEPPLAELASGYYRAGVDARRRAHTALAEVPDMVDDVEDRIEALLQRTLDLLGDETTP